MNEKFLFEFFKNEMLFKKKKNKKMKENQQKIESPKHLDSLELKNFLSFGKEMIEILFKQFSVIVGPSGSGKVYKSLIK